ncbi:MAG: 23S rRNA (guanosine(2251)-2'-O)-methyltransferase RlmB [Luteibaculum sp.]
MKEGNIIYGFHPVLEALESETEITKIWVSNQGDFSKLGGLIKIADARKIPVSKVPTVKLNKISTQNHQGVIAQVSPVKYWELDVLIAKAFRDQEHPVFIFLDGVTDTRNLGGIARSAACMGVSGIILPLQGSAGVTQDTVKTSAGAILKLPIARVDNIKLAAHTLLAEGFQLISITEKAEEEIHAIDFKAATVVIFGGEEKGINNALLKLSTQQGKIPMDGGVSSLNVSVAVGITAYEIRQQRNL